MIDRRNLLLGTTALTVAAAGLWYSSGSRRGPSHATSYEITRTDEEWQSLLSRDAYDILRQEGTERPYTSALLKEARAGVYTCGGCDLPVYASKDKYDSKTGWPSFTQAINATAVGTRVDYKLIFPRTEAHCSRCGGHLGHIFSDGPAPTNERHCINGAALKFVVTA